jgi:hypothetical protein
MNHTHLGLKVIPSVEEGKEAAVAQLTEKTYTIKVQEKWEGPGFA